MARWGSKKICVYCFCFSTLFFLIITFQVVTELGQFEKKKLLKSLLKGNKQGVAFRGAFLSKKSLDNMKHHNPGISYPILVWWSPLTGETGRIGKCGEDTCFFTINQTFYNHKMTQAFLFYGTDFNIKSLPLPRKPTHHWGLFHEESPKNNYKLFHEPAITLFNHTATFSNNSHMPLTTQYLKSVQTLTSQTYFVNLSEKKSLRQKLAPLVYVQSDCNPPSDRDSYIQELMKYIKVDSYGECLHNKDLPADLNSSLAMDNDHFFRILAKYKFSLAFENAVCDDYITEKLWRPLSLGVVPVYYGAPNVVDWLPSNKSAILVKKFSSPQELAEYIKYLDENDTAYEVYLKWKKKGEISNKKLFSEIKRRRWGVQDVFQDNYIDAFECMVCNRVWENAKRKEQGLAPMLWQAQAHHLSCPAPKAFSFSTDHTKQSPLHEIWLPSFEQSKKEAIALRALVERNKNFTAQEFWKLVFKN